MQPPRPRAPLAALLAAMLLAGAHAAADAGDRAQPTAAPAMGNWVHVTGKHNGSGVALSHRQPKQPLDVGQAAPVQLRFEGEPGARLALRAPPGVNVRLADGRPLPEEMEVPAGGLALQVQPLAQGLHYLVVTTTRAGRRNVQAVPLKVGRGTPKLSHDGRPATSPSGEAVISLPARPERP